MNKDSIPNKDPEFNDWFENLFGFAIPNAAALGLTDDQTKTLTDAHTQWVAAYPSLNAAEAAHHAATLVKDQTRATVESVVRPLIQQLQTSPNVTDEQRKKLKITVRSTTRTRTSAPASAPVANVDTSQRLRHIISYKDAVGNRAKPPGVAYCEIWNKVGTPAPTDVGQLTYMGNASRTPQLEEYSAAQSGQLVTYWLRWVSTRGEKGPWSEPISATVPG